MTRIAITLLLAMCAILGVHAQSLYPGQHTSRVRVHDTAPVRAEAFDLADVRLLPGRVRDNLERDSAWMVSIPAARLLHSFRNNAGVFAGLEGGYESVRKLGGWESLDCDLRGHTTGHMLSACALMYAATGQHVFKAKADSLVAGLAEVQAALGSSGYLSAFPEQLIDRNILGRPVWAPWYTLHKILAGLIDQYLYAGNEQALDIARRMGDWAYGKLMALPDSTRRLMLRNEFGGMNEAFFNLYAVTADGRFRELAEFFHHNDVVDPLRSGTASFGTLHTNTFIPKLLGEARRYELTRASESRRAARLFWEHTTGHHCFTTGSCSQKEHFFDPARMSQYLNGYTGETCCTYNMLKLSRHLFCWDADADVAEYYERALFNHILAQQDTASGMVCYFLPMLSGAHKVYSTPEQSFWCCVGSGFESHAKYAEAIYYRTPSGADADTLFVNLLIPSRLNWRELGFSLVQRTAFPESDTAEWTVEASSERPLAIAFRHPRWSGLPEVTVNGRKIHVKSEPGSYFTVRRRWRAGDRIAVRYPMELRVETTPDNPCRGAVLYGPIVLAGQLGTEGMCDPAPFSDPTVRNDYYTYDYHIPAGLPTQLSIDPACPASALTRKGPGLTFATADGRILAPLYDTHRTRYVVYWDIVPQKK